MSVPAFIDLSEKDQVAEIRQYFTSNEINVPENKSEDLDEDVKSIIVATAELWKDTDAKDIEGLINSILSLLFVVPIDKSKSLVELLCKQLEFGAANGKSTLALKLLHNLFHGYPVSTPFLYDVYCTWVQVAGTCKSIQVVPTELIKVLSWVDMWSGDQQNVLHLLYKAHINSSNPQLAAEVMVTLLQSYTEETAPQARDDAIQCITSTLSDPNTYLFDELLTLKPIKCLEGDIIFELLNIFVSGSISDYKEFYKENENFVQNIGLSHQSNIRKMQLLTLVDTVGQSREIDFDDVIEKLGIPADDVESFVIDAIQSKLIRGRIDHVNKKVIVSQSCQRTFNKAEWKILEGRLQQWKENLERVYERLQTVR